LHLLQRVRDEAHRFAVSYHVKVRNKRVRHSELDSIPGVGQATRKKLVRAFGSVAGVRTASLDELAKVVGGSKAKVIKQHLV
jgi:excinuclease ABC subunit C